MVTTWVLVIMLAHSHGAAVDHVPGFNDRAECLRAAEAIRQANPMSYSVLGLSCIEQQGRKAPGMP